jgi:cation diffusion facilitator CzcD-associated flavoprotein CzcO
VIVVGAGPYGLSIASHLRAAHVRVEVFGEPMGFWRNNTPVGMRLVSTIGASDISDPHGEHSLAAFAAGTGTALAEPLPAEVFTEYGLWFQRRAVPDVDERQVRNVEPAPG